MSELRRDPVSGRWVILTPEHTRRPIDFSHSNLRRSGAGAAFSPGDASATGEGPPAADPPAADCPFCEGHEDIAGHELLAWRPNGSSANGVGWRLRVVPNREPVLRVEAATSRPAEHVFHSIEGLGAHEVVIETPHHGERLSTLSADDVMRVMWAWRERIRDLKRDQRLKTFLIVKNHGAEAGARQAHSHSQIFAMPMTPPQLDREIAGAEAYWHRTDACVFCDIVQYEGELDRRVIASDTHAMALAPFASRVPFETWILPRVHGAAFEDASDATLGGVAARLHDALRRLDAALIDPPFNLVLHTLPVGAPAKTSFHWHLEIVPRLRPVTGMEWGSGVYVNQVPPEEAVTVLKGALRA